MDPGLAGLLGRQGPRSKQPFVVTFFQESENQVRLPRAAKQAKRRPQTRKTHNFPHSNRLPGLFGKKQKDRKTFGSVQAPPVFVHNTITALCCSLDVSALTLDALELHPPTKWQLRA